VGRVRLTLKISGGQKIHAIEKTELLPSAAF
jgi:hypothetical protein